MFLSLMVITLPLWASAPISGVSDANQESEDTSVVWPEPIPEFVASGILEARNARKPVVLDFTATWCGPCKLMDSQVIPDPVVTQELNHWVKIKIDRDKFPDIAKSFQVTALPFYVLIDRNGKIVAKTAGYQMADDFAHWLMSARVK